MKKPLTIALLSLGAVGALALVGSTYWALTAQDRATQQRIDAIGGESRKLQEGQQP